MCHVFFIGQSLFFPLKGNAQYKTTTIAEVRQMFGNFRMQTKIDEIENYGGYIDLTLEDIKKLTNAAEDYYGEGVRDENNYIRIYPGIDPKTDKVVFMITFFHPETNGREYSENSNGEKKVIFIEQSVLNSGNLPCPKFCDIDRSILNPNLMMSPNPMRD